MDDELDVELIYFLLLVSASCFLSPFLHFLQHGLF
jgi:hypothetical protein